MTRRPDEEMSVAAGSGDIVLNGQGGLCALKLGEKRIDLPYPRTVFGVEGRDCTASVSRQGQELLAELVGRARSGSVRLHSDGEAWVRILVRRDLQSSAAPTAARAGVTFSMPPDTRFHLAEFTNVGRRIDASMPVGECFASKLYFNFLVMETGGLALRARSDHASARSLDIEIQRHPSSFTLTLTWPADGQLAMAVFSSMHDAVVSQESILRQAHHIRRLAERHAGAPWLRNVRLVLTADMMRSDGSIAHDYADVAGLARDLARIGCPRDTVLYLPGWNGPYDSGGPTYGPYDALGGASGFRRLVEASHAAGLRVMIHTTGWGIDPYHPRIEELEPLVLRDEDGELKGWQTNGKWLPSNRSLRLRTEPAPIAPSGGASSRSRSCEVAAPPVPDWCEALLSVGGLRGTAGRVRVSSGLRSVKTPETRLRDNDGYDFPYPLLLDREGSVLRFEADVEVDWGAAWFRIRHAFRPPNGYSSWTWPILVAQTSHPDYMARFVASVTECVRTYGVDAVHVDATTFGEPVPSETFLRALEQALGDTPLSGEWTESLEEVGIWGLLQSATQSLVASQSKGAPREQGSLAMRAGVRELLAWVDQESEVCDFAAAYVRSYPHLCAANAFVPAGKVCNVFPPRRVPLEDEELRLVLRDAARLRYVPGLRVNYRHYGLDTQTALAIQEIARGGVH